MKRSLLGILLLFVPIRPAVGATVDLSHADLTPFLHVVTTTVSTSIQAPGRTLTEDRDLLVTRSGASTVVQLDYADGAGYQTALLRAFSLKADFDALSHALVLNHVGFQVNCQTAGPQGRVDIYWYGKGGRRNVFSIQLNTSETSPNPSLPQCSGEATAILRAVNDFYSALVVLPGAEVVIYPPGPPR